jgi:hypothetical protein
MNKGASNGVMLESSGAGAVANRPRLLGIFDVCGPAHS